MDKFTALPSFISNFFRLLPFMFKGKHRLNLSWLALMVALGVGFHKLNGMAKLAPVHVTEYRFRRLLSAAYWSIQQIMLFMVHGVLDVLPKPADNTLYVILDASKKEKRSKKNPYGQKGKESAKKGYFFGVRFITLMFQWNGYRVPVAYELMYPKGHSLYKKENHLFRKMIEKMEPPIWANRIIVLADAAYTSKDNLKFLNKCNHDYSKKGIFFGFVMAMAKTWKLDDETHLQSYVRHLKHSCFKKTHFTPITGTHRRTYWTFVKQLRLRHVGEVTIVLSKKRRNLGPKRTKVIVTNLPNATAHQVVNIYQRRFMVEVLFKELKTNLGLGKHQVTLDPERVKKSFGISFLAYLMILKFQHQDIKFGKPWSIAMLQEGFRYRVFKNKFEHDREKLINQLKKAA